MKSEPFYEDVKERFCGHIISSTVSPASESQILEAENLHKMGKCPHTIIQDEAGYMYDVRTCYTCGIGLGLI